MITEAEHSVRMEIPASEQSEIIIVKYQPGYTRVSGGTLGDDVKEMRNGDLALTIVRSIWEQLHQGGSPAVVAVPTGFEVSRVPIIAREKHES